MEKSGARAPIAVVREIIVSRRLTGLCRPTGLHPAGNCVAASQATAWLRGCVALLTRVRVSKPNRGHGGVCAR